MHVTNGTWRADRLALIPDVSALPAGTAVILAAVEVSDPAARSGRQSTHSTGCLNGSGQEIALRKGRP
jgi:hypothetical protein